MYRYNPISFLNIGKQSIFKRQQANLNLNEQELLTSDFIAYHLVTLPVFVLF